MGQKTWAHKFGQIVAFEWKFEVWDEDAPPAGRWGSKYRAIHTRHEYEAFLHGMAQSLVCEEECCCCRSLPWVMEGIGRVAYQYVGHLDPDQVLYEMKGGRPSEDRWPFDESKWYEVLCKAEDEALAFQCFTPHYHQHHCYSRLEMVNLVREAVGRERLGWPSSRDSA